MSRRNPPQDGDVSRFKLPLALASISLEALQPLVLVLAYQIGSTRLVNGHNPINFCNGLLFGNVFSLIALLLARRLQARTKAWEPTSKILLSRVLIWKTLLPIGCNALLEVALIMALSRINAVHVSLTVACTAVVLMLLDYLQQRRVPKILPITGAALITLATWIASGPSEQAVAGERLSPIGTTLIANNAAGNEFLLAMILILSVAYFRLSEPVTQEIGIFPFAIWQTAIQSVIFLIWATTTFGFAHLYDLQSPLLWQVMLIYGGVISTAYTLVESAALANAGGTVLALCEGFLPFASGLFAWLLLQETFTANLVVSCLIATAGIAMIEKREKQQKAS